MYLTLALGKEKHNREKRNEKKERKEKEENSKGAHDWLWIDPSKN